MLPYSTTGLKVSQWGMNLKTPGSTLSICPRSCVIIVISVSFVHISESLLHSIQIDLGSPLPREQYSNFSHKHLGCSTL